jgi:hypothetical protein
MKRILKNTIPYLSWGVLCVSTLTKIKINKRFLKNVICIFIGQNIKEKQNIVN